MWFKEWFNEDYLHLYAHRSLEEAKEQVDAIERLLNLHGTEHVLDLACGTGRHSVAFGMKGYQVIGIDLSETLIKKARQRLEDKNLPVKFHVADMFQLPDIGSFDLVVNLFTSFGYFQEDERNQQVFDVVCRRLVPNGAFFLDYLHPHHVRQSLIEHEELIVKGEQVSIQRKIKGNIIEKQIHFPGRSYCERVKLYSKDQIIGMLQKSNLQIEQVWNDYKGNPWKEEGDRQLFYCIKN